MKTRILTLLLSFTALGLTSCNDWLELTPTDRVSDKSAWESQQATDLYINNFYEYIAVYGQFGDQQFQGNLTEGLTETFKYGSPILGTRAGDSVALLCISRTLNMLSPIDASEPMSLWNDVVLWEEGMQGYTPDKKGRVRSASFMLFATKEPLPYEVRYLTAAEELSFFGNSNTFLLSLDMGEAITELTQLKRLTVGAYGLTSLPASMKNMKNLVYLNLGSNNFQTVPSILSKENFPNLRSLVMNANQRSAVYDLSNSTRTDLGGLMDEQGLPERLIKWDLDTLVLSVNYLQGELPTFEEDDEIPYYTQAEIDAVDSLPQFLVDNRIKKVMPSTKLFAINLNRFYGKLPDWLLYHPALVMWFPFSLVFPQEGRAKDGTQAGFDNEPANLNYYYDLYTTKTRPMDGRIMWRSSLKDDVDYEEELFLCVAPGDGSAGCRLHQRGACCPQR